MVMFKKFLTENTKKSQRKISNSVFSMFSVRFFFVENTKKNIQLGVSLCSL